MPCMMSFVVSLNVGCGAVNNVKRVVIRAVVHVVIRAVVRAVVRDVIFV